MTHQQNAVCERDTERPMIHQR